ncbi:Crp/Fnr family transcriptional regulator [Flammeovirga sp. SubArs3]|uniref:Crp/Fnr family transcriptional regulator n=1 Tax=Flammeovirga sp. SubArs3 TaxID=2995316 RepID=UPI00248C5C71|nr:Crp/Fnr family transcriptional regulator [Flammeovirga sp. SubArs3]
MRNYLNATGLFNQQEIDEFLSIGKRVYLQKGEFYLSEGEIAKKFAFVVSGVLRSFYYSSKSEEITYCFCFNNELISGYSSMVTQLPTRENIQAIDDCELIEFSMEQVNQIIGNKSNWLQFSKEIAERNYIKLEQRIFILQKENAQMAYNDLLERHAEYLNKIPLGYLASYLGISQRHLSRIRKEATYV